MFPVTEGTLVMRIKCLECAQTWGSKHLESCPKLKGVRLSPDMIDLDSVDYTDCLPEDEATEVRETIKRMARESFLKSCCPDCLKRGDEVEMGYICALAQGDEEARGSTSLYQCPKCKTVDERY